MSLKENFSYENYASAMGGISRAAQAASKRATADSARRPPADVSKFGKVASSVKDATSSPGWLPPQYSAPAVFTPQQYRADQVKSTPKGTKYVESDAARYKVGDKVGPGVLTTAYPSRSGKGSSTAMESVHPGIDIGVGMGTPLQSPVSGEVVQVRTGRGKEPLSARSYGNYVVVKDANGNLHRFSHLKNAYVKVGTKVRRGQYYGEAGNTGSSYSTSGGSGSHLDYRVQNALGYYINPEQFIS